MSDSGDHGRRSSPMDVAPLTAASYLDPHYWDERFAAEEHYEWFKDYSHFQHLLRPFLNPSHSVLEIGCGNSRLCEELRKDGVADMTCVDISPVAVERMWSRFRDKGLEGIKVVQADMLDLPFGSESFDIVIEKGTMVEIKNMNSFSSMNRAIDYEISRQVLLHSQGQSDQIFQETRLWEEGAQKTFTMRKKEGLADYRYFPEHDLPEVVLTKEFVNKLCQELPELPEAKRRRYEKMGLAMQDVLFLANDNHVAEFFDASLENGADPKLAANWIMGDISAFLKNERLSITEIKLTPFELSELIASIKNGTISGKIGKEILFELLSKGGTVQSLIEEKDLVQIVDPAAIEALVDKVLAANPKQLEQYRAGKTRLQGFFAGQVMKESKGKANPLVLNKILGVKLKGES